MGRFYMIYMCWVLLGGQFQNGPEGLRLLSPSVPYETYRDGIDTDEFMMVVVMMIMTILI